MKDITVHQQWQEFIEKAKEWAEHVDLRNGEDAQSLSNRDVEILTRLALRVDKKLKEMMKAAKEDKEERCLASHPVFVATVCMKENGHKGRHEAVGGWSWADEIE